MIVERLVGVVGIAAMIGLVYLFSRNRRAVRWRQVFWGLGLQVVLALIVFRVPGVNHAFEWLSRRAQDFVAFGDEGALFLFGDLAGDALRVEAVPDAAAADQATPQIGLAKLGTVVILKILPTVIFVSSAMSILYHLGVLQRVVSVFAWTVRWVLRVSGAEALAASANVFLGMTEAPLLIRPYLKGMTASELKAVMVGGFATISGSMMAVYNDLFGVEFAFLMAASVLNAPAAPYLTKVYLPETETPSTLGTTSVAPEVETVNVVDAAANGATTGLRLALNIGAVLLAFAAGLKFLDAILGWAGAFLMPSGQVLSLGMVLGWICYPFAWLLGVPAQESAAVGQLLGTKVALNEYFAYQALSTMQLSERTHGIATFALCGFANFGSIAIQLGGIGGLVPERRGEIARYGIPAMFIGAAANCITAAIAGVVIF